MVMIGKSGGRGEIECFFGGSYSKAPIFQEFGVRYPLVDIFGEMISFEDSTEECYRILRLASPC